LSRDLADIGEKGLRLDADSLAAAGWSRSRSSTWNRIALWVIAAALVVVAVVQLS
jgi:ubiquinone biosynthesis protein